MIGSNLSEGIRRHALRILQRWRKVVSASSKQGYWTGGADKIYHNNQPDPDSWQEYWPSKDKHMPDYHRPLPDETVNMPNFEYMYGAFDWSRARS